MNLLYYIAKRIFIAIVFFVSTFGYINAKVTIGSDNPSKTGTLPDLNQRITNVQFPLRTFNS